MNRFDPVGVAGSTGTVLHRSLLGARALTGRSLAEVRLAQGVQNREQFLVGPFIEELTSGAAIEGRARGIALRVLPVEEGLIIEADRQVLTAIVVNLLQNASSSPDPERPSCSESVPASNACSSRSRTNAAASQAEMSTSCSGRSNNAGRIERGWGLGLAFSRWGVEQNNGRIYARNLAERGCVFTIDLPRIAVAALAAV
jgi:signal transduction histidine kinase